MSSPLTATDEMIVPIPLNEPPKVDSVEIRIAAKYDQMREESQKDFIISCWVIGVLIIVMLLLKGAYRYAKRKNWYRKPIN